MKRNTRWIAGSAIAVTALVGFAVAGGMYAQTETERLSVGELRRGGGGGATTFSGRAVVLDATLPVVGHQTLGDTGSLPSSGGNLQASLLEVNVPPYFSGTVGHATTIAQGDRSRSEASVADATLVVGGHTVSAGLIMSRAMAACEPSGPQITGSSELVNLVVDGQAITVSGSPNQTVTLPSGAGYIIINEQEATRSPNSAGITVNALHIVVRDPLTGGDLANVVIASAHADITCGTARCTGGDFVTGGGYISTPSGSRGTFGVAGGIRKMVLWGHLTYIDHGTNMMVKGTGVTVYTVTGTTSRHIEGTAEVNGVAATYKVDVADNGEPGRSDIFTITLSTGYTASGTLLGGNIQLHQPCK